MQTIKANSFGILRLFFATMVLIKHSSDITGLNFAGNLGIIDLGTIGVFGFFSISGYLITPGLLKSGARAYLARRFFRIYPAYLVAVMTLGLVFCPLWSYMEYKKLFFSFKYIFENVIFFPQSASSHHSNMNHLMGFPLFTHAAGVPDAPFWSLSLEFACYIALVIIFLAKWPVGKLSYLSKIETVLILFLPFSILTSLKISHFFLKDPTSLQNLFAKWPFVLCFLFGSALSIIPKRVWNRTSFLPILAILIWFGSNSTFRFAIFGAISITLLTLIVGESRIFTSIPLRNDISYGIYLYHYPIEQSLAHFHALSKSPVLFTAVSASIAVLPAYLSAKLIEGPMQRKAREIIGG